MRRWIVWLAVIGILSIALVLIAIGCVEVGRSRHRTPPTATQPDQYDDWLDGTVD